MMGWLLPLIVLAGVLAMPWLAERRRHGVDVFRDRAPGRFAKLSAGATHYQWLGAARGPVIVCVHGLTTPSPIWYALADRLGKLGFRVLVYDLFGRGFSDAPTHVQTIEDYQQQLEDLLAHQSLTEDLTLVGFSMGGMIASAYASAHPSGLRRLILVASAGVQIREDRLVDVARRVPVLGDWVHHMIVARRDRRALRAQLGQSFDIKGIVELQLGEFKSKGFLQSVWSSRRYVLPLKQADVHEKIEYAGVPVVAIWAEKDEVIPLRSLGTLTQWNRAVRQNVITDADHRVLYTHSTQVAEVLEQVLRDELD